MADDLDGKLDEPTEYPQLRSDGAGGLKAGSEDADSWRGFVKEATEELGYSSHGVSLDYSGSTILVECSKGVFVLVHQSIDSLIHQAPLIQSRDPEREREYMRVCVTVSYLYVSYCAL